MHQVLAFSLWKYQSIILPIKNDWICRGMSSEGDKGVK